MWLWLGLICWLLLALIRRRGSTRGDRLPERQKALGDEAGMGADELELQIRISQDALQIGVVERGCLHLRQLGLKCERQLVVPRLVRRLADFDGQFAQA